MYASGPGRGPLILPLTIQVINTPCLSLSADNWLEQQRHLIAPLRISNQDGPLYDLWFLDDIFRGDSKFEFERSNQCKYKRLHPIKISTWVSFLWIWVHDTDSTSENRYPIQARGPPRNVSMLPQMPGILVAASGIDAHRSGLWMHEIRKRDDYYNGKLQMT